MTAYDTVAGDHYARSVAIQYDGYSVAVGAFGDDSGKGSAYVYRWNGFTWTVGKKYAFDGVANDCFGVSADFSIHPNHLFVGSYLDDAGANADQGSVYIFNLE